MNKILLNSAAEIAHFLPVTHTTLTTHLAQKPWLKRTNPLPLIWLYDSIDNPLSIKKIPGVNVLFYTDYILTEDC